MKQFSPSLIDNFILKFNLKQAEAARMKLANPTDGSNTIFRASGSCGFISAMQTLRRFVRHSSHDHKEAAPFGIFISKSTQG